MGSRRLRHVLNTHRYVRGHDDARKRREHRLYSRGDNGLDFVDEVKLRQEGAAHSYHRCGRAQQPGRRDNDFSTRARRCFEGASCQRTRQRSGYHCARQGDPALLPVGQPCPAARGYS
jgi:hypothetical protein